MAEQVSLDAMGKTILKALAPYQRPAGCEEIPMKAGLPTPKVTGKMRGLLQRGFVATPLKGRYTLTKEGTRHAE
jgi:DNA-binding IclR family transcriptional regulator